MNFYGIERKANIWSKPAIMQVVLNEIIAQSPSTIDTEIINEWCVDKIRKIYGESLDIRW